MKILGKYYNQYEDFYFEKKIGISNIYFAYNKKNGCNCSLEVISKEILKSGYYDLFLEQIKREEKISKLCKSEYFINLNQKYETEDNIILEYEYYESDLEKYLDENGELEREKDLFKEIILSVGKALKVLHEKGIIHRNIRPSNIFFKDEDKKIIKLGNFHSSIFKENNKSEQIGNLQYSAPEIIKNLEYDEKCDLWSLGITLYELYFGELPFYLDIPFINRISYGYYNKYNRNSIIKGIYEEKKFIIKKTKIPTLDILFKRLLTINPKERMSYDEFFEYIFNENFMKKDIICINNNNKYKELYDIILNEPSANEIVYECAQVDYSFSDIIHNNFRLLYNYINGYNFPDIISISDEYKNKEKKSNNIIYYDENINNHAESVYKDCKLFENNTNGAFILCYNLGSLNLIMKEVLKISKLDKRFVFNIIVTGSKCEIIMEFLQKNPEFDNCIKNICVYCYRKDKYIYLKEKYKKIQDIYSCGSYIINYIKNVSSEEIKPFPQKKIITFENYLNKYKLNHLEISQFYFNDLDSYKDFLREMKLEEPKMEKEQNKIELKFDFRRDLRFIEELIIDQYKKNLFYDDLINIDINIYKNVYDNKKSNLIIEVFSYLMARSMYLLNHYAQKNNMFYKEKKILYKGDKLYYSSIINYERSVGQIILFTSFTAVYEQKNLANIFSGRNESVELYNNSLKFSVIFYITNNYNNNWIPNIIFNDKEKLDYINLTFLPFSFFLVKDIKIDIDNYTADIFLETIGKVEILEEEIRKGKKIEYNQNENIMKIIK